MAEENQELTKTLEQFAGIAFRRRWWILLTACGIALAAVGASLLLPNRYKSEATILVVQQQVPQRYVVPNTTYSVQEAIQSLTEAVLSRTRLLPMVSEFGLYAKEKQRLGPEGLVELMRKNIDIAPVQKDPAQREVNAFKISFTADNALVAQSITSKLTSFFIEENLKLQEQQDTGTTSFLKDQLAAAQQQLQTQEQSLREFKMRNLGELPEQQQGNLAILSGLHMQLQNTMAELSRAQEQRVYLRSLISQYRDMPAMDLPAGAGGAAGASPNSAVTAEAELARLRTQKAGLLARYTPEYPDVVKVNQEIVQTEALLRRLTGAQAASKDKNKNGESATGQTFPMRGGATAQLQSQLKANQVEIDNLSAGEKRLQGQITEYEHRLNLTPVREQQLSDLLRNYNLSKEHYTELLGKVNQSEMATNLAQRQQGQQFRVVDPPSLPAKPSSPNRIKIGMGGAAAGLFLAAILAFLIDSKDHSFRSEKDVSHWSKLPLVIAMPLWITPAEERRRSWKKSLEWVAATALVLMVLVAEYYVYRRG
ncbi:MAG TPA: Wzz/FepE/Etk N-terminal domain-containing protein [Terriglobia bacterium]|nr:Wzz/FepE/Etk N-terminal domain-containing protein [Terriglobia bacterium]